MNGRSRDRSRDDAFELDEHALAMLAAYREEEHLPGAVQERVWARVERNASTAPKARARRVAAVLVLAVAAGIAATVIGLRAWTLARADRAEAETMSPYGRTPGQPSTAKPRTPSDRVHAAPSHAHETNERERAPTHALGDPLPSPAKEAAPRDRTARKRGKDSPSSPNTRTTAPPPVDTPREPAASSADTLTEELRALERVRTAISIGRPAQALAELADVERKFPHGMLREEREALRVIALCDAGRTSEGSSAARAFLAAHPRSALADRVRNACTLPRDIRTRTGREEIRRDAE